MKTRFAGMLFWSVVVGLSLGMAAAVAAGEVDRWNEISQRAQARLEEFFVLVDAHQTNDAIALMDPNTVATDAQRQAWRSHLEAIRAIHVTKIEPFAVGSWTSRYQKFKVTLEAYVMNTPAAPLPFYGWHDNPNIRWITMILGDNGAWQIHEIATGP